MPRSLSRALAALIPSTVTVESLISLAAVIKHIYSAEGISCFFKFLIFIIFKLSICTEVIK